MIRNFLPTELTKKLWGDRKKWGLVVLPDDSCWREWQKKYGKFYEANQRKGVGTKVNDAGYRIMSDIDLSGKKVLEIGAGDIRHIKYWNAMPDEYILVDISQVMMKKAEQKLKSEHVHCRSLILERNQNIPLEDNSVDVVVSFYSLEHLYPLKPYLEDMKRILKSGGVLVGAIPAEGGLVWGGGRMMTSRRWFKKNTNIDPDKIICWEHPNFADEIISDLDQDFARSKILYWPFSWLSILDINLVIKFIYKK